MKVRKFRLLRLKYGIQLEELGDAAGLSKQRVSQVELGGTPVTKPLADKLSGALFEIILDRLKDLGELERDYTNHKDSLFELAEDGYEL
jgi:transcriptional regulator with XRE-family HTH domain